MLIELVRVIKFGNDYTLKKVFINPKQIIYVQADDAMLRTLNEGGIPLDLHQSTGFSKVKLESNGLIEDMVVVGDPEIIHEKIRRNFIMNNKQLLRD